MQNRKKITDEQKRRYLADKRRHWTAKQLEDIQNNIKPRSAPRNYALEAKLYAASYNAHIQYIAYRNSDKVIVLEPGKDARYLEDEEREALLEAYDNEEEIIYNPDTKQVDLRVKINKQNALSYFLNRTDQPEQVLKYYAKEMKKRNPEAFKNTTINRRLLRERFFGFDKRELKKIKKEFNKKSINEQRKKELEQVIKYLEKKIKHNEHYYNKYFKNEKNVLKLIHNLKLQSIKKIKAKEIYENDKIWRAR